MEHEGPEIREESCEGAEMEAEGPDLLNNVEVGDKSPHSHRKMKRPRVEEPEWRECPEEKMTKRRRGYGAEENLCETNELKMNENDCEEMNPQRNLMKTAYRNLKESVKRLIRRIIDPGNLLGGWKRVRTDGGPSYCENGWRPKKIFTGEKPNSSRVFDRGRMPNTTVASAVPPPDALPVYRVENSRV